MDVFKRLQQVASVCTWLMLALAFGGVLAIGPELSESLTVNQGPLLIGLGVAALGAAIVTAISITELQGAVLTRTGPVIDQTSAPADINAEIIIDLCVRITEPGEFTAAPNSPAVSLPLTCQVEVDPTSGNAARAELTNLVTAL